MPAPKKDINLLPRSEWEKKPFSRVLKWSLTFGRYIVVFTEFIVIVAFLSRFKLDRSLSDLYEKIELQQAQIKSEEVFEKNFRFLQERLATAQEIEENTADIQKTLSDFIDLIPPGVKVETLNLTANILEIEGSALTENNLSVLIKNLKKKPEFDSIGIDEISRGDDFQLNFSLVVYLTEEA